LTLENSYTARGQHVENFLQESLKKYFASRGGF